MCLARKKVFQLLSPHSRNRIRKKNPKKCFSRGTRIWLIVSRWFMSVFSFIVSSVFFFCSGLWKENHSAGLEPVVVMSFVVVAAVVARKSAGQLRVSKKVLISAGERTFSVWIAKKTYSECSHVVRKDLKVGNVDFWEVSRLAFEFL